VGQYVAFTLHCLEDQVSQDPGRATVAIDEWVNVNQRRRRRDPQLAGSERLVLFPAESEVVQ
jgi:hypothetical protein